MEYDLIVIGGGPAGYPAAIRAGQLGKKVACIEMERPGGTCLNWGCIPSKALLKTAETFQSFKNAHRLGLHCENPGFQFPEVIQRSRKVADTMAKGIEFLFKKNKVDHYLGTAQVISPQKVEIKHGRDIGLSLHAKNILLATGCKPLSLPNLTVDGKRVMTSREVLAQEAFPESIIILGAGAIGVEFAYFFNALGAKVSLVEMQERILALEDKEVSQALEKSFKQSGINIYTGYKAQNIQAHEDKVCMELAKEGSVSHLEASALLLAIGLKPYTEGLIAPGLDLKLDAKGYIVVDDAYQSSIPGIYAAGDIIGPPWLAHVATFEAIQAVNGMFNHSPAKRKAIFPACTYCQPQVASIGLTEEAAKAQGIAYEVGKFPFMASGKAVATDHPEGFIKVLSSKPHGEILGAHIIGADATELINEFSLAIKLEATLEDLHSTIHAHPTLSEGIAEAAAATHKEAIHI
jgi:dihydrolipoamide dehydrogenase